MQILNSTRRGTGSQRRTSRRSGLTWSYFLLLQRLTVRTTWTFIDAKVTSNSNRANQGTADTELPGVEMGTPSAGRAPKKLRLLRIKSIRSHPLRDLLNSQF